ncbi:MAG TPA: DUF6629 family protein [Candidatus Babeliales bacterium]|nr:DUF6629 family protein [Candidatus Babeliales bacterium]
MCFSSTASFTASGVLLICGIGALIRAKKNQRLLAMMPILFSIQQFIEGTIWQSLMAGQSAQLAIYAYLTFVYIVWPNWPALAISKMTSKVSEKKLLTLPLLAGILISILTIVCLTIAVPQASITCSHIVYTAPLPHWLWFPGSALYLFATIAPFFIASIPHLWLMGVLLAISYAVTFLFYNIALLSVWCFFAALLSAFIFIIIK